MAELVHLVESGSGTFGSTLGWSRCRDIFMRRDSGGHGAGTPQWTSSGHWSPPGPTIPTVLVHSEECITGTLRQTHPIQRRSFETALKNSEHSDGVNLLSFLSESEQKVVN